MTTAVNDLLDLNKRAFHDINATTLLQSIPFFSGEPNSLDVKKWFKTLERSFSLWTEEDKMRYFPTKLIGPALKFHDNNVNRYLDYDGWKERLIERFHVPRSSAFYKQQFDNLVMNSSERVIDFVERLESSFKKAYESDTTINNNHDAWKKRKQVLLKDRFMIGLTPTIKSVILHQVGESTTFDQVQRLAKDVESSLRYTSHLNHQDPMGQLVHKINSIETQVANLSINDPSRSRSRSNHSTKRSSTPPFYNRSRSNSAGAQSRPTSTNFRRSYFRGSNSSFAPRGRGRTQFHTSSNQRPFTNHPTTDRPPTPYNRRKSFNKEPFRKGNCFNCGKLGHFSRECRKKVSFQNKN